jgi:hypothetical protein
MFSIDPGKDTGCALWEGGYLVGLWLGEPVFVEYPPCWVHIEKPQIYPSQPVPPNDIITLAITAGCIAGHAESNGHKVEFVLPHTWKGNLPKEVSHKRILGKLSSTERLLVDGLKVAPSKKHNVLDAIGIGLWVLRR